MESTALMSSSIASAPGACVANNFVSLFAARRLQHPQRTAIVMPAGDTEICVSYQQLANEAAFWQTFWRRQGFIPGDRVVLAFAPDVHLYAMVLSLLGCGLVPVFIDAGMSRRNVRCALHNAAPVAVVGLRQTLRWHWLIPELRNSRRFCMDGRCAGVSLLPVAEAQAARDQDAELDVVACLGTDHGLISYTTGSTGSPKGADRTHYSLQQQHLAIRRQWPDNDGDVDSPCFPVMVLHNLSCGMTTVLPAVDFANPGALSDQQAWRILDQIARWKVNRLSGAPAYLSALCNYMQQHDIQARQVSSLVLGGATVSRPLAMQLQRCFPDAHSRIAYGSTEAEPICELTLEEYLQADIHSGYLVGRPVDGVELVVCRFLPPADARETDIFYSECAPDETGEILVAGEHVLRGYIDNRRADAENKIPRNNAQAPVWHRTGDTGYIDSCGRLWLTGRVRDQIFLGERIIQPLVLEQQLDQLDEVSRSALIQSGGKSLRLYLVCDDQLLRLKPLLQLLLLAAGIHRIDVYRLAAMPVDRRHNSKIDRALLRARSKNIQVLEHKRWKIQP